MDGGRRLLSTRCRLPLPFPPSLLLLSIFLPKFCLKRGRGHHHKEKEGEEVGGQTGEGSKSLDPRGEARNTTHTHRRFPHFPEMNFIRNILLKWNSSTKRRKGLLCFRKTVLFKVKKATTILCVIYMGNEHGIGRKKEEFSSLSAPPPPFFFHAFDDFPNPLPLKAVSEKNRGRGRRLSAPICLHENVGGRSASPPPSRFERSNIFPTKVSLFFPYANFTKVFFLNITRYMFDICSTKSFLLRVKFGVSIKTEIYVSHDFSLWLCGEPPFTD